MPTSEPEEYIFRHIKPVQHKALLQAITLSPDEVTDEWMADLDRLIAKDNELRSGNRQRLDKPQLWDVRQRFAEKLGLLDPDHCLHQPYRQALRSNPDLPASGNIMNIMVTLSQIGGSVDEAIAIAQAGHNMLGGAGTKYRLAALHIGRLIDITGWKGDTLTIIKEAPELFRASMAKRSLFARLVITYGRWPQRGYNLAAIRKVFANPRPEEHLMALLLRGQYYTFGQILRRYRHADAKGMRPPWNAAQERRWIYGQLSNPRNVELVGPQLLRAFFRYQKPGEYALRSFPHLQHLRCEDNAGPTEDP